MMAYSEDHIALAAEYALGTLDADERAQAEAMMAADKEFTAMVEAWQHKLGVLNQMVGAVEPRPELWDNIRSAAGLSEPQAPLVLPDASPPLTAEAVAALAEYCGGHDRGCGRSGRHDRGRGLSAGLASRGRPPQAADAGR